MLAWQTKFDSMPPVFPAASSWVAMDRLLAPRWRQVGPRAMESYKKPLVEAFTSMWSDLAGQGVRGADGSMRDALDCLAFSQGAGLGGRFCELGSRDTLSGGVVESSPVGVGLDVSAFGGVVHTVELFEV